MRYLLLFCLLALGLTASSQIPDYVPSDGLVAWYGFANSGLEGTGNAPEMLLVGNATFTTDRSGIENNALDPNGGSANTDGPFFDYGWGDAFSLSMWFTRPINTGGNARLISTECPEGNFRIANDAVGQGIIAQMGTYMYLNPLSDAWHQVVYTYDGDATKRVYLDGALYAEEVETDFEPQNFCNPLALGRKASSSGSDLWPGDIDDLGIWDRCLGEEEILGLYLSEVVVYGCTNEEACNYNPDANVNDGSCYSCDIPAAHCGEGTYWDTESQNCVIANPSDTDFDGCVGMIDLLDLLSVFGTCTEVEPELGDWSCGDPLDYQGYDYETVQIGGQCWFAENLRAEQYSNGDPIPMILDDAEWQGSSEGARCWINNDSTFFGFPGFLYHGYAVTDNRGVCPEMWHVANDLEWMALEIAHGLSEFEAHESGIRGGDIQLSQKMRVESWGGTNELGFAAQKGGYRRWENGSFSGGIDSGAYWSNGDSLGGPGYREFHGPWEGVARGEIGISEGLSIRCIQDSE